MRYKITRFQLAILVWIARKIVIQSQWHEHNIIMYYSCVYEAAKEQFTEDNKATLDDFMNDCNAKAMEIDPRHRCGMHYVKKSSK